MPIKIDTKYVQDLDEMIAELRTQHADPELIYKYVKLRDKAFQRNHERILIRNTRAHATNLKTRARKRLQEAGPVPTLADITGEAKQTTEEI